MLQSVGRGSVFTMPKKDESQRATSQLSPSAASNEDLLATFANRRVELAVVYWFEEVCEVLPQLNGSPSVFTLEETLQN